MIRPIDLIDDDLWNCFEACCAGEETEVRALVGRRPAVIHSKYDDTAPLHFAVREGHAAVVRYLLEQGAKPHTDTHQFRDSLLTMAQQRGHAEVARLLLDRAARQFPVAPGVTSLIEKARQGDGAGVASELARDVSLARASNDTGDTALHAAAGAGHIDVMKALLDAGANPEAARADERRPVHCALEGRQGAALSLLMQHGAAYSIYLAAALGDMDAVRQALSRDASLANFADAQHRPISAAAWRQDLDMVKLLLDHGADPSLPEEGAPLGQALWTAVYQHQPEMVKLLLEHGADPNTAPEASGSALSHARKVPELRELLLAHGATNDTSDRAQFETFVSDGALAEVEERLRQKPELARDPLSFWGEGILAVPANRGDREMIELLLRFGAQVPAVAKWGPHYYFKDASIGALLLARGMPANQMNWQRFSLLHRFAAEGDLPKMRLLLDHGAAIDAVNEEYRSTPLGCAARWGAREAVALLLERGADPQLAGAPWAEPLVWAQKRGHAGIAADLRVAGAR